jgi:hypothetical protein
MKLPSLIVCLAVLLISNGLLPQRSLAGGVVGTGTPDSCTEHALSAALNGGGVVTFNCGGPATITVTGTPTIQADTTVDGGGVITISGGNSVGIAVVGHIGNLTVQNLTFADGNGGPYSTGGALYNNGGTLTVTNCTFSGNGNAIYNTNGGTLTITNSTFSGNTSTNYGPGAIYNDSTLSITNSTFSGNSVGTISNSGTLTVTNCTFSGNGGSNSVASGISNFATLTVTNTIIANSTTGANCSGTSINSDGGHNIDDRATCHFSTANGSLNNTNPLLDSGGLASNGGPTQTIALEADGPAIDAGDEAVCAAAPVDNLDQRGYGRPGVGETNCSIGAYEYNGQPSSEPTATATETPVPTSSPTSTPTAVPTPTVVSCVGDCNGDGQVTVDEILTMVNIALGNTPIASCEAGDANHDGQITVDEILAAVNNALNGCPSAAEQGCLGSGGAVTTVLCCAGTDDFPETCFVGACSCSPDASHEVRVCDCSAGTCFNGTACVTCPFGTCSTDSE